MSKTVIIAGQGALPGHLAATLKAQGAPFLVAEMEGFPARVPGPDPIRFRVERLVPFLDHLAARGVTQVSFAGAIRRPRLEPEMFDARTATLVPRLLAALQAGDDAALRVVIGIFEEWGFAVVGAQEIAPELLPHEGVLTLAGPAAPQEADAELGEVVVADMGRADLGQACIIAANRIVAREGEDGTDALLRALLPLPDPDEADARWRGADPLSMAIDAVIDLLTDHVLAARGRAAPEGPGPAEGGILFKAPKPNQDLRADLPVIGPQTAMLAAEAGLSGIVIEAGGVMVLDLGRVVQILDGLGMFLWVRPRGWRR